MRDVVKILFLLILLLPILSAVSAQNPLSAKIDVSFSNIPLEKVLDEIEKKGNITFSYNATRVPGDKLINHTASNTSIRKILDNILDKDFDYKVRGSFIILVPKTTTTNEQFTISGVVRDKETNENIGKVTIYEINSLSSDLSNEEGGYDLTVKKNDGQVSIAISAENYRDTVIHVSRIDAKNLDVALTRSVDTSKNQRIQQIDTSSFAKFFVPQNEAQNLKNVSLYENRIGQISFLPSVGTNRRFGGLISNDISINAIAGYSYGVNAVEIGGVMNIDRKYVRGIQAAGVGNSVGGAVRGVQVGGVFNIDLDSMSGVQIGGAFNIVNGNLSGVQLAGVFNNVFGETRGVQIAGVYNLNTARVYGSQISGLFNLSNDLRSGVQVAGLFNVCDSLNGVQIAGLFNRARHVKGVQIGVVNIADSVDGATIGLFNFVKSGLHQLAFETNDVTQGNLLFRMGVPKFYSFITAGARFWGSDILYNIGYGFGSGLNVGKKFIMDAEISTNHIQPLDRSITEFDLLNKIKLGLGFKLASHLSIHTGPILNIYLSRYLNPDTGLFGHDIALNPFYSNVRNSLSVQMWLGYSFELRF